MNADKARKLSEENSNRLASQRLTNAIDMTNANISEAARAGYYNAGIEFYEDRNWSDHGLSIPLENHFKLKGFDTEITYDGKQGFLRVSW